MEFQIQRAEPHEVQADWLILGTWQEEMPSGAAAAADAKLGGLLPRLTEVKDLTGKPNELTPILDARPLRARRLVVVGLGKREKADVRSLHAAFACAARHITAKEVDSVAVALPEPPAGLRWRDVAVAAALGTHFGTEGPGIRKSKKERFSPSQITIVAPPSAASPDVEDGVRVSGPVSRAVSLCRELVNLPPCDLYPETFASRAQEIAAAHDIECTVFDEARLKQERMGSLLGVAQGSDRPPRLVVLRYTGAKDSKTLGLVGKGVTFDSGGLSLKTTENMLDMKCDMAGAASVLAGVQAVAELKLPVNVVGVLALVENMPSGKALKLGDVLTARNGKTIEIHNTDAEGRLILADALSYAVEQKVDHLVDLATLTGACMVALGTEVAGLMSNDESWAQAVQAAARRAGELVWPLPMFPLYSEMIKSHVADMKNTGGTRWAGAITAAKLLEEFVDNVPWVHLDIAGPAWADEEKPHCAAGGTGALVRTLVELAAAYPG